MKASKTVLWLYLIRCALIYLALLIFAGVGDAFLPVNYLYVFTGISALFLISISYLFLYYKSLSIHIEKESVHFTHGVILKREIKVCYKNIASYITTATPVAKLMSLRNLSLKVQGAKFLIFPLEADTLDRLTTAIDKFREEQD